MNKLIDFLKKNIGLIIVFLSFAIVIVTSLINGSLAQALESIVNADGFLILLAVMCFFGHILFDSIANRSFIKRQGYDLSVKESFYASAIGVYYSTITPAGTGGFPMQIYYLNRQDVPVGVASSSVTCFLNAWYFMRLVLLTIFIFLRYDMLRNILGNNMIFLVIGYIYNIYVITLFLVLGFVRKPIRFVIDMIDKLIRKFNLSRNPDSIRQKLSDTAERYHEATQNIIKYPSEIIRQLFFGFVYVVLLNSIIYIAYRSVGLSSSSYYDLFCMSICLYIAAAYMPTPGGAGAHEIIFSLFFSSLIDHEHLLAVMLIWRFISFYLILFSGAIMTGFKSLKKPDPEA